MAPAFLLEFVQDKSDIAPHDAVDLFLLHFFGVENPFLILILVIFAWWRKIGFFEISTFARLTRSGWIRLAVSSFSGLSFDDFLFGIQQKIEE